jgi:hypothetical protein
VNILGALKRSERVYYPAGRTSGDGIDEKIAPSAHQSLLLAVFIRLS